MVDPDVVKLSLENPNMDLHYEIQGQGEPIVLLHSGGADSRDWQFVVPQLAQTYRVMDNQPTAELFQQVPDIRFAWIEEADHTPTLTHADQLSSLIKEFLSE